ncbi:MAG: serine/threonine-protein kinase, partial [Myxococcota bacterium]
NIARMLDMGFQSGSLYLVFEYLDGPNLRRLLDEARRRELLLPFELSAALLHQILDALHFAHELRSNSDEHLGLVHRDVNARNVLTSFDGRVALIDFGIARTQGFEGGQAEEVVRGKLGSVAPEQLRGEPIDRRADIFACGVLMYEMLIGSHPFKHAGATDDAVLDAIVQGDFLEPSVIAPELPGEVLEMVQASLSPKVEQRPGSAAQVAAVFEPYTDAIAEDSLASILTRLFPSLLASVQNLRYLAEE